MQPLTTLPPPSLVDTPLSAPGSRNRSRTPLAEVVEELEQLTPSELAELHRYARRIRASRGDRPSPELISRIVAVAQRYHLDYPDRLPISLIRSSFPSVPRILIDRALFEAEEQFLLRLEPSQSAEVFIERGAAIENERGLLYWIVPV